MGAVSVVTMNLFDVWKQQKGPHQASVCPSSWVLGGDKR